ncbi:MAG: hypothetical protein PR2021_2460 [Candidatus Phytoplasma pruni]|uniref:hypothetical protein n=1 Tax=Poinsettia branch-inducing phytoplasma TaxID=138647 RepID=UPI0003812781|nr:hypothetical protein [Poinsettia branch-inducing phytoplasma]WEK82318.1 MAG: hypothetical protein PR2021_2460 [Candidatus Phytoplasma pruni]
MYIILNKPKVMKKDQNKKFTVYNKIQLKVEKLDNNDKLQLFKDSVSKNKIKCIINYKLVPEQQYNNNAIR